MDISLNKLLVPLIEKCNPSDAGNQEAIDRKVYNAQAFVFTLTSIALVTTVALTVLTFFSIQLGLFLGLIFFLIRHDMNTHLETAEPRITPLARAVKADWESASIKICGIVLARRDWPAPAAAAAPANP